MPGGKKAKGPAGSSPATPAASSQVNSQITDAITETSVSVVGEAPAIAMGNLYQTVGNSWAMAAANAVYAQQQANVTYQSASTIGVTKLLRLSVTS